MEHLISCEFCRRDVGEEVSEIIKKRQIDPKKADGRKYLLYFVIFILFIVLTVITIQYINLREHSIGKMSPLSHPKRIVSSNTHHPNKNSGSKNDNLQGKVEGTIYEGHQESSENLDALSEKELILRFEDCNKKLDYKCISRTSMQLAKKTGGEERRRFRLKAIEALVELKSCSAAMLNIMMLLNEEPNKDETNMAHLLNAKCYVKEGNYQEADRILKMLERDAIKLKKEISDLKKEIEKGGKDAQ